MPQTPTQILRCLTLGGYTARVVDGRLETEGPQPLAGSLPASIEARRPMSSPPNAKSAARNGKTAGA